MTQIGHIINEIERLKQEFVPTVNEEYRGFAEYLLDIINDDINSIPAEQPSEDLEAEIDRYFKDDKWFSTPLGDIARHFANWQKEQMSKNAVRGCYIRRNRYTKTNVLNGFSNVCDAIQQFKDNDKVRIIIIKEDEQ